MRRQEEQYATRIKEAVCFLQKRMGEPDSVCVVLGSGWGESISSSTTIDRIAYEDIPGWPVPGVPGHTGELIRALCGGRKVTFLSGRVHLFEGLEAAEVAFPVRVMSDWGARLFVLTNAAGGIAPRLSVGNLMLISDQINLQMRALLGGGDPPFVDMSSAFDPVLRIDAEKAAANVGIDIPSVVYLGVTGPAFETPAEIAAFCNLGADAVGMSTVQEVIALRQAGRRVLGISLITNMAAGLTDGPISHEEVVGTGASMGTELGRYLSAVLEIFPD